MITNLTLKNFKAINSVLIQDISRITLIGGRNNCGKTTLLEAIYMLFDMQDPNFIINQLNWRGISAIPMEAEFMWGPVFHNFDFANNIEISAAWNSKKRSLRINYKKDSIRKMQLPAQKQFSGRGNAVIPTQHSVVVKDTLDLSFSDGDKQICASHLYCSSNAIELNFEKQPTIPPTKVVMFPARLRSNPDEEADRFGRIDIDGKVGELVAILTLVEPKIKGLSVVRIGNTSMIYADLGVGKKIPIPLMGDGIARLLTLSISIITSKGGIVLVDEIENGIHHSVLPNIWKALFIATKQYDCQLIATTHSHECLTAAYQGSRDSEIPELSYIRLQNKSGNIVANTFTAELLESAINSELEIR